MHRKISLTMRNFVWCVKFIFGCILWFHRVCEISYSVRNCPSLNPAIAPFLDFVCYVKFSHSLAKMLHVGFLLSVFFLASLIGLEKGWSAPKLGFFMYLSFNLHCHGLHKILPHSWLISMIKKLPKTPKLAKNWLVTLVRFLNVPIVLKSINYYSKVFKTVNFKL